jgi:hypothetical protein
MKRVWLLGIILFIGLGITLSYTYRTVIAENIGERWCKSRDLICTFEVEKLSISEIKILDLNVGKTSIPTILSAANIALDLSWPSGLTPNITRAEVAQPTIRGEFDGRSVSFGGLEDAFGGSSNAAPMAIPELEITGGQIQLTTPAGDLTGNFDVAGTWPKDAKLSVTLEPANLKSGAQSLTLNAAKLDLNVADGAYSGRADVDLPHLNFDRAKMTAITANAIFLPGEKPQLEWNAQIGEIILQDQFNAAQMDMNGIFNLRATPTERTLSVTDLIDRFTLQATTAQFGNPEFKAASTRLNAEGKVERSGTIAINMEADANALQSPYASIAKMSLRLDAIFAPQTGAVRATVDIVGTQAQLDARLKGPMLATLKDLSETSSHAASLEKNLNRALDDFTSGGAFRIDYDQSGLWQIVVADKIALRSTSGLNLLLRPSAQQSAVVAGPDRIELQGLLTLDGGGAPTLNADLKSLTYAGGETKLNTGGLTLAKWQPGPTSIAAKLNRFSLSQSARNLRMSGLGELTTSGRVLGIELGETRIFGGIDAVNGREGWRVQTTETPCIGLEMGRLKTGGGIQVTSTDFTICPEDQRFIRQENGRATGRITLGDITLPFQGTDVSGEAQLTGANVLWSYDDQLQLNVGASRIFIPLQIGGRSLNIAARTPLVDVELANTTRMTARVSSTSLSGQLVPANVTIGSGSFEGRLIAQGFTGQAAATDVRISDINPDPVYQPLLSTLNANFDGTRMSLAGPVRLAASGLKVAQVGLDMDLLTLNGSGFVTSETLQFQPRGLQPKDLSDRARGFLSNGRGSLSGRADLLIRGGALSGTGEVTAREFGFDTLRIGAVDGVNGTLAFSDLLGLTTPPGQSIKIGKLNPGIPLNNGALTFQILGGSQANIEAATWPFAGGVLRALPTKWTIAGASDIITIEADKIELASLIETLSLPDIQAEGTVSGTFPIELQGGNAFVRNARLIADSKGGVIRYTGNALPETQGRDQDNVTQAAFKALRNLRYSVLELGVNGNLIGDIVVSLKVLGKNPDVLGGAEFSFNIAVDSKLAQLIQTGRGLMSSDAITETTINEIKRLQEARQ